MKGILSPATICSWVIDEKEEEEEGEEFTSFHSNTISIFQSTTYDTPTIDPSPPEWRKESEREEEEEEESEVQEEEEEESEGKEEEEEEKKQPDSRSNLRMWKEQMDKLKLPDLVLYRYEREQQHYSHSSTTTTNTATTKKSSTSPQKPERTSLLNIKKKEAEGMDCLSCGDECKSHWKVYPVCLAKLAPLQRCESTGDLKKKGKRKKMKTQQYDQQQRRKRRQRKRNWERISGSCLTHHVLCRQQ